MLLTAISIFFYFCCFFFTSFPTLIGSVPTFTLPHHQLPSNPEDVVREVQRRVNASTMRSRGLSSSSPSSSPLYQTGNPVDDCWGASDMSWQNDRQKLAECGIGFGKNAAGGQGGQIYVVEDSSDDSDPGNPKPGTLRYGVTRQEKLWITFSADMKIELRHELFVNSYKTIDGRGANVHITGVGCITLLSVTNVIIHNLLIYYCKPSPENDRVQVNQQLTEKVSSSDGDGISVHMSSMVWVDHCTLIHCEDGLIDVTQGSTAVTISNNLFLRHDKVMLLGHSDDDNDDAHMQVTVAFNRFGEGLTQRMPRCRKGYFHVFNNHYTSWGMYAIGGSANPTINSQGNHFTPPANPHALEVTKRTETSGEGEWSSWNWRSTDDVFENGAFFVPSGDQSDSAYQKATSSADVKSGGMTKQLTSNVGMLILTPNGLTAAGNGVLNTVPGVKEWNFGNIFDQGGGAPLQSTISPQTAFKIAVAIIILVILVSVIKRFRKKTNGK